MNGITLDIDKNTAIADRYCRQAAKSGAHFAVFPEMFNIAYPDIVSDPREHWREVAFQGKKLDKKLIEQYRSYAIDDNHPYLTHFRQLALTLNLGIAVTYMSRGKHAPRNTVLVIDRHGRDVIKYSKIHLFAPNLIDAICEPGEELFVRELDTQAGSIKLGTLICADRDIPELSRILMKKGAEVVILSNSCPLKGLNGIVLDMIKVRAFENAIAVAVCNYPNPIEDGHSTAFNPDGTVVVKAGHEEGIFMAEYDLDKIRHYRETTMMGDAFREEHLYKGLLGGNVLPPFKGRKNAMGERPLQYLRVQPKD